MDVLRFRVVEPVSGAWTRIKNDPPRSVTGWMAYGTCGVVGLAACSALLCGLFFFAAAASVVGLCVMSVTAFVLALWAGFAVLVATTAAMSLGSLTLATFLAVQSASFALRTGPLLLQRLLMFLSVQDLPLHLGRITRSVSRTLLVQLQPILPPAPKQLKLDAPKNVAAPPAHMQPHAVALKPSAPEAAAPAAPLQPLQHEQAAEEEGVDAKEKGAGFESAQAPLATGGFDDLTATNVDTDAAAGSPTHSTAASSIAEHSDLNPAAKSFVAPAAMRPTTPPATTPAVAQPAAAQAPAGMASPDDMHATIFTAPPAADEKASRGRHKSEPAAESGGQRGASRSPALSPVPASRVLADFIDS